MKVQKEVITNEIIKFDKNDIEMIMKNEKLLDYLTLNNDSIHSFYGYFDEYDTDNRITDLFLEYLCDPFSFDIKFIFEILDLDLVKISENVFNDFFDKTFNEKYCNDESEVLKEFILQVIALQIDRVRFIIDDLNDFDFMFNKKGGYGAFHNSGVDTFDQYIEKLENFLYSDLNDIDFNFENLIDLESYSDDIIDDMIKIVNEYKNNDNERFNNIIRKNILNEILNDDQIIEFLYERNNILFIDNNEYLFDDECIKEFLIENIDFLEIDLDKFNELTNDNKGA